MVTDEEAIATAVTSYQDAPSRSDADAVTKLFTTDGVLMAQESPSAVGAEAVRQAYGAMFGGSDSLRCAKQRGIVCMTGMVGNKWSFDDFAPMEVIPTTVCLTAYDGGPEDFMLTPLQELVDQIMARTLRVQVGRTFRLDEIVEAHRHMEENRAGGKIVVLT
jgi:D-arabinose 1-dehydrogenase-like Zn-dependent alcohol dehydrogenase